MPRRSFARLTRSVLGAAGMATALGQTFAGADREAEVFAPIGFVQALRTTYPQFDEVDPQSHGHKQQVRPVPALYPSPSAVMLGGPVFLPRLCLRTCQDADELYNNVLTSLANTLRSPVPGVEFKGTNNVIDELFQIKFETTCVHAVLCVKCTASALFRSLSHQRMCGCHWCGCHCSGSSALSRTLSRRWCSRRQRASWCATLTAELAPLCKSTSCPRA